MVSHISSASAGLPGSLIQTESQRLKLWASITHSAKITSPTGAQALHVSSMMGLIRLLEFTLYGTKNLMVMKNIDIAGKVKFVSFNQVHDKKPPNAIVFNPN